MPAGLGDMYVPLPPLACNFIVEQAAFSVYVPVIYSSEQERCKQVTSVSV